MARTGDSTDFNVDVEGIGTFRFGRRRMRDEIKIQVEYARLIDGAKPTDWLSMVAGWIATLKVMTVQAPEGWDIDSMDPLDDASYANLMKVNAALSAKEASFRRKPGAAGEGGGQGEVQDGGVLVPPTLPAGGN